MQPMKNGRVCFGWEALCAVMERPFCLPTLSLRDFLYILPLWLSNPLLWVGVVLWTMYRWRASAIVGVLALIGGTFLPDAHGSVDFLLAGIFRTDCGFLAGYFVWLGSMLMLVGFNILRMVIVKSPSSAPVAT